MVWRHNLDWRLQSDQRFHLHLLHDGPVEGRVSVEDLDLGDKSAFLRFRERRKAWGAYCRKDWLEDLEPEEFSLVFFCCADDQITPKFVETVMKEFSDNPELQMLGFNVVHHHYGHRPIPLGTWPALSHCDWSSFVVKTELAKKVGITDPDEYACDGIFLSACFGAIEHDPNKIKILDNFLVVKN
jgi:hypothetical protein